MRHRKSEDKKKEKSAISIDIELEKLLSKYLESIGIWNRSKYLESLIRKDMEERGNNIKREF